MTTSQIILLVVLEMIALGVIIHLWLRRRRLRLWRRVLWSVVLLVPFAGILIYALTRSDPDEHPYDTDTTSGSAITEADGGGHHT